MNDPYKILNISPTASDDEVKHAYRELARKYHPDNYHDNPLADLAQEKMKEINKAYETIQRQRKAAFGTGTGQSGAYAAYGGYSGSYAAYGASRDPAMQQVRAAIQQGNVSLAERLLANVSDHNAEWNFLMGVVCSRRGWMDEARRYLQTACQMDPANDEYRQALSMMDNEGYRPVGWRSGPLSTGDDLCTKLCAASLCMSIFGGGSVCFLPCLC